MMTSLSMHMLVPIYFADKTPLLHHHYHFENFSAPYKSRHHVTHLQAYVESSFWILEQLLWRPHFSFWTLSFLLPPLHNTHLRVSSTTFDPSVLLLANPRQAEPQNPYHSQKRQDDRLQHLDTLSLGDRTDYKRENSCAATAKRGCETNSTDVQMLGEQLCGCDDGCGKHRGKEETLEGDGDG